MAGIGVRGVGNTGLKVSSLGFGASALRNVFGNVKEEDTIALVHEAFHLGINFFDTSPLRVQLLQLVAKLRGRISQNWLCNIV